MQEEQLYAECGQDERTSIYQSYFVFALLFWKKNLNKARYSIYGNLLQFLALKVPLLRRNKATNSSTSTDPFSAATKTLYYASVNSSCAQPSPAPPFPGLLQGICSSCQSRGEGICKFGAARGPGICQLWVFDTHAVFLSEYNYTKDFTVKTSRLAHLSRRGKNWRSL